MAIKQLSEEQVRTMSLEEKDRWWLQNVFRGDMPQLTLRAGVTGFLLGGVLSATNLYIGAKTGWSLGVGITSVILAFALWKVLVGIGIGGREFTILENNAMQSIATAAGYMTSPMISSLTAYMIVTNALLPWHVMTVWIVCVAILGVLFAFPMKRRFINDEQQPFPEGRAAGVVMDALHSGDASVGVEKARVLLWAGGVAALAKFLTSDGIQELIQHHWLGLKEKLAAFPNKLAYIPEQIDQLYYWAVGRGWARPLSIGGIDVRQLGITPALDISLAGAGGLMGIRGGVSLFIGAIINYCILAPIMINNGEIHPALTKAGVPRLDELGNVVYGFRPITLWALWPGVAILVVASFAPLVAKPQVIVSAFKGLFRGGSGTMSPEMRRIELPLGLFIVGIPVMSVLVALLANHWFGVNIGLCLLGIPLTFVLALIGANSTALTSTTPIGAMSKITQLFYGVVDPKNIKTNLITASVTAEVVSNASNLLMDIKPGYMLGAKPRQQAIGHVIGIFAGAIAAVPLFFLLFTHTKEFAEKGVEGLQSEKFPMPAVTVWKAVAEVLTEGISKLSPTILYAVAVAVLVGIAMETARIVSRGRFPLSAVGLGLAFVINFQSSMAMFAGALFFWLMGVGRTKQDDPTANVWVRQHEPICAGIIAGAALMGILDAVVTAFVLPLYN
jgi:uncharacterized oligopeptide transporter (OPT) family protein